MPPFSSGVGVGGQAKYVLKALFHTPVIFHVSSFLIFVGMFPINKNSLGSSEMGWCSTSISFFFHTKSFHGDSVGSVSLCSHLVAKAFIWHSKSRNLQPPWRGCCDIRQSWVWVFALVSDVWPFLVDHMNVFIIFVSSLLCFLVLPWIGYDTIYSYREIV